LLRTTGKEEVVFGTKRKEGRYKGNVERNEVESHLAVSDKGAYG
jgi:hypothetical protein